MKEEISAIYTDAQKQIHAFKPFPDNRRCVVTGVSENNIGNEICDRLDKTGFQIYASTHEQRDLTMMEHIIPMLYHNDDIDTIVLCHAIAELSWIESQNHESMEKLMNINLISNMKIIAEFANGTIHKPYRKTIIVIGSMAGSSVLNGSAPYCASKAGLQHYVKCAAWELAPKGFDVYLINPSNVFDTPMTESIISDLAEFRGISVPEAAAYWSSSQPRGTILTKGEIAELTCELALGKFPFLTGSPINLSGSQR